MKRTSGVKNKRQQPSVKRLRKRRVQLDSIKRKIHEEGIVSLGNKQRAFYDDQRKFDDQDCLREIAYIIEDEGIDALTDEQKELRRQYRIRCRVATFIQTGRVSNISSKDEDVYEDLLRLSELENKIQSSGIKKLSKEERSLYDEHLENKRKWRSSLV